VPEGIVYRKALFRDRNQTTKRTLVTLEPADATRTASSTRSIGANSRSTPKIVQIWFSRTGQFWRFRVVTPRWPDRSYIVLGYLDATTAPIRRRGAVSFAVQRAKELRAEAIVVMRQGQAYAGSISNGFFGKAEVLAIKWK
jgi:hypothetical protein